jgi:hypothetical protein
MARVGAGSVCSALGFRPPFVWLGAANGRFDEGGRSFS